MRIGIYTNRLPYPPTGGIPRFLYELEQALELSGVETEFILSNLEGCTPENQFTSKQSFIEDRLSTRLDDDSLIPNDIKVNLKYCTEEYSPKKFHSISIGENNSCGLKFLNDRFDALIIAGSALMICHDKDFIKIIPQLEIPTIFSILFPLAEILFYYGEEAKKDVVKHIGFWINNCDLMVVPSEYSRSEILSNCKVNIPIITIPFSVKKKSSISCQSDIILNKSKNVVSVSRFSRFAEHKNIDSLLLAWSFVKARVPEARLTLIGEMPLKTMFDRQLLMQPGIFITGEISDSQRNEILKHSRVFALPSSIEAFGFTTIEALSMGVPVIGMNLTATPELIRHTENGILLEPVNTNNSILNQGKTIRKPDIDELGKAIVHILMNDCFYSKLSRGCITSSLLYSQSNFAEKYISCCLYHKIKL